MPQDKIIKGVMEEKCKARWGAVRCDKDATTIVIVNGEICRLCKECSKIVKKQNKANQSKH